MKNIFYYKYNPETMIYNLYLPPKILIIFQKRWLKKTKA